MLEASYYDGRSARRHDVSLSIRDGRLYLSGATVNRTDQLSDIDFGEPLAGASRCIEFLDGACCEVSNETALAKLLQEADLRESLVVRMQRHWRWALASLLALCSIFASTYIWGLPALAKGLAPYVPSPAVQRISDLALAQADHGLLTSSVLPAPRQQQILEYARARLNDTNSPVWRLHFRGSPTLGANAFALPAGDIVLLDGLVAKLTDEEILGVLAHELGHVVHHHGIQQLIEGTAISLVMAAWFGDVSSVIASAGALLAMSGYSREAEAEADAFAARRLLQCCASSEALVSALGKLQESGKARGDLLSTHPDTIRRITAIREIKP